ncbi:MAG: hypothetical protein MRJ68_11855 [Nitrospira sp.]|nr:hypothetical protein [Nitrospira sp.]
MTASRRYALRTIFALYAFSCLAIACDTDDAASHGVLIVDAIPEFIAKGCQKIVVWDDAAEAYYRTRPLPDTYCQHHVGEKAIPFFEQARRKRGLPPGSYAGHRREIERLNHYLQVRNDEAERLRESIERAKTEIDRDPVLKTAHKSVNHLSQYGIAGVACAKDFSQLESCPRDRSGVLPPVSRTECLAYLQRSGYADPCPAFGSRR